MRGEDRAALVKLHGLLDAEQRNAFVDALEKQMKAKHGEHKHAGFGKLKELSEEMKLTDEQRSKIHDVMRESFKQAKHEGGEKHHFMKGHHGGKKVLEAFREDKLDLDKVAPPHDAREMAKFGTERMAGFAEKILPILTPEQRSIAAGKVRTMANTGEATPLVQ